MGQKVHPFGLRLGIIQDWRSRWYAERPKFAKYLESDIRIRSYLTKRLSRAGIARIEIERADKSLNIAIYTARPGIVIGKGGVEVDQIRKDIEKMASTNDVQISVLEVRFPELDANLVSQGIAEQLIARVPFRRAMRRAVSGAMKTGAQGVKVMVAGRLGGSEMARTEWYREGQVPLHTLRADIDYGYTQARTTFGSIGVKVWLYKGERSSKRRSLEEETLGLAQPKKQAQREAEAAAQGMTPEQILEEENKALAARQRKKTVEEPTVEEQTVDGEQQITEEKGKENKEVESSVLTVDKKETNEKKKKAKVKAKKSEEKSKTTEENKTNIKKKDKKSDEKKGK